MFDHRFCTPRLLSRLDRFGLDMLLRLYKQRKHLITASHHLSTLRTGTNVTKTNGPHTSSTRNGLDMRMGITLQGRQI
jgi:hypothetical protein